MGTELLSVAIKAGTTIINQHRLNRVYALIQRLKEGNVSPDDPIFKKEEVIGFSIAMVDALQKANGHEKIDALMDLFVHGVSTERIVESPDDYYELLSAVSSLSNRELTALVLSDKYLCKASAEPGGRDVVDGSAAAYSEVAKQFGISLHAAQALLCGIQRTGMIQPLYQPQAFPLLLLSSRYETLKDYAFYKHRM